jgi:hypothetical protein
MLVMDASNTVNRRAAARAAYYRLRRSANRRGPPTDVGVLWALSPAL